MRPLILFTAVSVFYFLSQAQIDFNSLIDESAQQQNITATEVHRFAGVNSDRTQADYNITVVSETSEFDVKLKKVAEGPQVKKVGRKPASKKAASAGKASGKKKKL